VIFIASDLTGPTISINLPLSSGTYDYLLFKKEVVGKKGGVTLVPIREDTKYDVAKAKEAYARAKAAGMIAWTCGMSGLAEGLLADFERDHIPFISSSSGLYAAWSEWHFSAAHPGLPQLTATWMLGMVNQAEKEGRPTPTKFGWSGGDAPFTPFFGMGLEPFLEEHGFTLTQELLPIGSTDASTTVARLKEAGVEEVFFSCPAREGVVFLKAWTQAGMDPGKVTFAVCNPSTDAAAIGGWDLQQGAKFSHYWIPLNISPDAKEMPVPPGHKLVRELWELNYPGQPIKDLYLYGMVAGMVIEEAIKLALDEVTPDELTGDTLREHGLWRMKEFDPMGMTYPITYGPGRNPGPNHFFYGKVVGEYIVPVTDWIEATGFPPPPKK
jgi:ABC-type branched-subunit amino acid transport system substrate-binding protein